MRSHLSGRLAQNGQLQAQHKSKGMFITTRHTLHNDPLTLWPTRVAILRHAKDSADGLAITSAGQPDTATFGFLLIFCIVLASCFFLSLALSVAPPSPLACGPSKLYTLREDNENRPEQQKVPPFRGGALLFRSAAERNWSCFQDFEINGQDNGARGRSRARLYVSVLCCEERAMLMPKKQRFLCKRTSVV